MVKGDNALKREVFLYGSLELFLQISFLFFLFSHICLNFFFFFPFSLRHPCSSSSSSECFVLFMFSWFIAHWSRGVYPRFWNKNEAEISWANTLPYLQTQGQVRVSNNITHVTYCFKTWHPLGTLSSPLQCEEDTFAWSTLITKWLGVPILTASWEIVPILL